MDDTVEEMVMTAFDETLAEALAKGIDRAGAMAEGITAASMCLAAMTGIRDAAARAQVEKLGLGKTDN